MLEQITQMVAKRRQLMDETTGKTPPTGGRKGRVKKRQTAHKHVELEARIGFVSASKAFKTGCTNGSFIDSILNKFENAGDDVVESNGGWKEFHDYFYEHKGKTIRCRSSTNDKTLEIECENIEKQRHESIQIPEDDTGEYRRAWRISLSTEQKLEPADIPNIVKPTFVRITQRKSYNYKNKDSTMRWRYDISLVWSGHSKTDAEKKQFSEDPLYEFEIELEYCHPDISDLYTARSLWCKMMEHLWINPICG